MGLRLHRDGRTRAWIGRRFGGDESLGDRIWRRILHLGGLVVLAVYVVPAGTFGPVPVKAVPVLGLAVLLALEAYRWRGGVELPTLRAHEHGRMASYAYYGIALVIAVLVFPEPIAVAVVLGAALVDPLLGELRLRSGNRHLHAAVGVATYTVLAAVPISALGEVPVITAGALGLLGGAVAVAVEGPDSLVPLDDDLAMIVVPGLLLAAAYWSIGGSWVLGGP